MTNESASIVAARHQLHVVAENFIAGPQYRVAGTIRLDARRGGFAGVALSVAVEGTTLRWPGGAAPLVGPVSALVRASGLDVGPPPESVYQPAAPLASDAVFDIDPEAADVVYRALDAGRRSAEALAPQADPILWPEHFDVSVTRAEVNYGVSPGDDHHPLPYAYVGPWEARKGAFWNAPFGALLALSTSADVETLVADITSFFERAQSQL